MDDERWHASEFEICCARPGHRYCRGLRKRPKEAIKAISKMKPIDLRDVEMPDRRFEVLQSLNEQSLR